MRGLRLLYIITVLLYFSVNSSAQADIGMSTHWYNRSSFNPAFIARTEYLYLFTSYRHQWVGIDGAPKVFIVQGSEYIHRYRSAFGVSLISDNIGVSRVLNPMAQYAYRVRVNKELTFSLGLAAGAFSRTLDGGQFSADVQNDPSVEGVFERNVSPDANAGIEIHSKQFSYGASITHIFSIANLSDSYSSSNHRYLYVIYRNNNSEEFFYKVGLMAVNRNNFTFFEGNLFIRLKHATGLLSGAREIFDFGLTVRSTSELSIMAGILLNPDLRLAYAYDHSFIKGYALNSSHEIMLEYRIPNKPASTRYQCGE